MDTRYAPVDVVEHNEETNVLAPVEFNPGEPCSSLTVLSFLVSLSGSFTEEVSNGLREVENGGHLEGMWQRSSRG